MDSGSECSVVESVEDNGDVKDVSNFGEPNKVQGNGSYVVENSNFDEFFSEVKENGTEVLGSVNSIPEESKPGFSPFPSVVEKGKGLRKWRRIKRGVGSGKVAVHDILVSGVSSSKRAQVYAERNEKDEDSASSTNAVVRNLEGFSFPGDLAVGPSSFAADTDSDDSADRSSKSSTAASVPKITQVRMVPVSSRDKSRDKLTRSVRHAQLEKGRTETSKEGRMVRVKIEKENSHSSVESDLRSSNVVFMQGTCSTSNGIQSGRWLDSDGEHGEEAQCSEREISDGVHGGYSKECVGECEGMPTNEVSESPPEVKEERNNSHSSSTDQDNLVDSFSELQSVHDALQKELLKFREIEDVKPSSEGARSFSEDVQSELFETVSGDLEAEREVIFKQKIEAEVKLLAVSRTVEHLRSVAADPLHVSDKPEVSSPDKTQLDTLKASENQDDKVEIVSDAIETADEALNLQKRVCKNTMCFFVQLVLLVIILAIFKLEFSPNYVDVVPT